MTSPRRLALVLALVAPLTAASARAQPNSSQHPRVGQIAEVTFARGAEEPAIGQERALGRMAAWAQANPEGHLVLESHTDRAGRRDLNARLALRRAQRVRFQLMRLGIPADQIVIASYGERGLGKRRLVAWGTRAGLDAIVAWAHRRGTPTIWTGLVAEPEREPAPGTGAIVTRR